MTPARSSSISASIAADRARDGVMTVHAFNTEAGEWEPQAGGVGEGAQYRWQMTQMLATCTVGEVVRGLLRLCAGQGEAMSLAGPPSPGGTPTPAVSASFNLRVAEDGEADFDFPSLSKSSLLASLGEVKQTGLSAYEYQQRLAAAQAGEGGDGSLPVFAPAGATFGGGVRGNTDRLLGALKDAGGV